MFILFPTLFVLCTSFMAYNVGVLETKHKAIEEEHFCLKGDDCYMVFQESTTYYSFHVGQEVFYVLSKYPEYSKCPSHGTIEAIEDDILVIRTAPELGCPKRININFEHVMTD